MKRLLFALLVAGCGNPAPSGNDLAVPVDASGGAADLAGCACGGLTPKCNAKGHCVGCLVDGDCAAGLYCKIVSDTSASCTPGCSSDGNCPNGGKCCGGRCVDPTGDPANCGGCGMACSGMHAQASCTGGKCMAGACDEGWGDCNNNPMDGCESNLHADPANCTACGMACSIPNAYSGCADGCYAAACKFGYDDCNNNAMDGCETSVLSDPKNCGMCGKSCNNLANAIAGCTSGNCVLSSCNQGYADCNKNPNDGCEVAVGTDVNNCGKCGNVCPQGNVCKGGGCTCPMCNIPNASANCVNNMCVFAACNPGYADCNNNVADGCETNLLFDNNNCTKCGMACPQGMFCVNGVCGMQALPCSMVATAWCKNKGWVVQQWATAFPNQPGGAIYCTPQGGSAAQDCDTCNTYNELVWKATAKDACGSGEMLVPGNIYGGHNPCACGPNLYNCGQWPMNNCMPD